MVVAALTSITIEVVSPVTAVVGASVDVGDVTVAADFVVVVDDADADVVLMPMMLLTAKLPLLFVISCDFVAVDAAVVVVGVEGEENAFDSGQKCY